MKYWDHWPQKKEDLVNLNTGKFYTRPINLLKFAQKKYAEGTPIMSNWHYDRLKKWFQELSV